MNIQRPFASTTIAVATATIVSALAFAPNFASAQEVQKLPTTPLNIGIRVIQAEVAKSDAQREQGLMFRKKMGANEGMVFIFDQPNGYCMWMKNTLIPLSVAFIDANGKILNIEEMKAQTLDSHCAQGAALYALEMNEGWFKKNNVKANTVIEGIPK
ncbi:DUF192 domain-containing protein [Glaciimonas soli]|uniref:DUF192 domain-containing protein n=1 Tax=Glaciimonas soli TaxID=2590999 RepID=A0A843YVN7_9BURK|nr:DUF192 domain-containing protein [Glaciimonas soli]MQR01754.1 DUF192 domain-containing protein [Glaciimonas soli]